MDSAIPAPVLSPDHGIDAGTPTYPDTVAAVFSALAAGLDGGSDEHVQLAARTVDGLNEVAEWANDGQSADPTACLWLSYLRWARCQGVHPPAGAPAPPAVAFDRDLTALCVPCRPAGDTLPALATGELGEVVRPVRPRAVSPEVLTRSVPLGLVPNLGWRALVPIVVDAAAITHGDPEAQTAAAAVALSVHAAVRAQTDAASLREVLTQIRAVIADVTRPAPATRKVLELCLAPDLDRALREEDGELRTLIGEATTATGVLGLTWAALLSAAQEGPGLDVSARLPSPGDVTELTRRARDTVSTLATDPRPGHALVNAVVAARWPALPDAVAPGDETATSSAPGEVHEPGRDAHRAASDTPPDALTTPGPAVTDELTTLATRWCRLWCPRD